MVDLLTGEKQQTLTSSFADTLCASSSLLYLGRTGETRATCPLAQSLKASELLFSSNQVYFNNRYRDWAAVHELKCRYKRLLSKQTKGNVS